MGSMAAAAWILLSYSYAGEARGRRKSWHHLRVEGEGTETRWEPTETVVLSIKAMSSIRHPPNHSFNKHSLSTFLAKGLLWVAEMRKMCTEQFQHPTASSRGCSGHQGSRDPDFKRGGFVLS